MFSPFSLLLLCFCPAYLAPQIYFWEAEQQNETARVKTLFLPENGIKLKNLTGYTTYLVSILAFNAAGDGPRSDSMKGRTQQAGGQKTLQPLWFCSANDELAVCFFQRISISKD